MARRDAPRILFFHQGPTVSDEVYDFAYTLGSNIGFRNATGAGTDTSLEPCVAVAAEEPEHVPREYYEAYPFVTTAKEVLRAARGDMKAEDNPSLTHDDDDELDLEGEDQDEALTGTEYDLAPYVPDTSKTDEENAALKTEWDTKEVERVAMLPARDTLAVDHPAYKAPSGPRRQRRKATKRTAPAKTPEWKPNA